MSPTKVSRRVFDDLRADRRRTRPACLALVVVLLIGLTVVAPLAASTLPDSLWVTGLYDGSDYDDLIGCSGDGASPVELADTVVMAPLARCALPSVDAPSLGVEAPSPPPRGPPTRA